MQDGLCAKFNTQLKLQNYSKELIKTRFQLITFLIIACILIGQPKICHYRI